MNKIDLFIKYIRNNRIIEYENIIESAIANNYKVISLRDYITKKYNNKILVLRHDVDHKSKGTRLMFEIEKRYGVTSSYYFRNSTVNSTLIHEIEEYGSEASLHFETISDYVKEHPEINSKKDLFDSNFLDSCLKKLKKNIIKFRDSFGVPCVTIASHGELENSLVKTPNNYLTEDVSIYEYLGIKLEAYKKGLIDKVTCYISDCPIEENSGFKYGITPIQAIENDEKFIMFLSHPNHWHYSLWRQFKKLVKVTIRKPLTSKKRFKRI